MRLITEKIDSAIFTNKIGEISNMEVMLSNHCCMTGMSDVQPDDEFRRLFMGTFFLNLNKLTYAFCYKNFLAFHTKDWEVH